jgi:hypothetical protein
MTLKEKFRDKILSFLSDNMKEQNAIECEQIADDYAIEFAQWMAKEYWLNSSGKYLKYTRTSELLEIFKKEKGL